MMPSTAALWLCCLIRDPRRRSMGAVTCETRDPADSRMVIGRGGALCGASDVGALLESLRLAAQAGFESLGFVPFGWLYLIALERRLMRTCFKRVRSAL